MYSSHHAVVSSVVASLLTVALWGNGAFDTSVPMVVIIGYATVCGVLIDLDHFLIARVKTGGWDAVRFCLANPIAAVADQERIFARGDVGVLSRLLSHVVLIGLLVPIHLAIDVGIGIVIVGVLYVHLVTDILWDIYRAENRMNAVPDDRPEHQ